MARVNQMGEPVEESELFPHGFNYQSWSKEDLATALGLLCSHLKIEIVRTNATKHGATELVLRGVDE